MGGAGSPLLEVDKLSMRFGGLTAVNALSFTARSGEITALIGPNGAGKTTVFNCITGFYRPTSGSITLTAQRDQSGKLRGPFPLHRMADHDITARAHVARTFQNIRLFSGMTLLENLLVAQHRSLMRASGYSLLGLVNAASWQQAEGHAVQRALAWLERIGLLARADDPAGDLPYGDQRRLEIARAMLTDPVLLCLDEPAAGLNPRESADLNALLRSILAEDRTAIVLIEHDMSVVMEISHHVVVLEYGTKIADGTPAEVKADPKVIAAYLGVADEEIAAVEAATGARR